MTDPKNKPKIDLNANRNMHRLRLIREDEKMIKLLDPESAPERRKYPESEFRRNFLPIITGEAYNNLPPDYTQERLCNEANKYWLAIAGGAGYEVDVVTEDGSVAFTMPAIMDTSVLNTAQEAERPGLRHLNQEFQNKIIGMPVVAERLMTRGLSDKLTYLYSQEPDRKEAGRKIDSMRTYYNLPPVNGSKSEDGAVAGNNVSTGEFMGEMEF